MSIDPRRFADSYQPNFGMMWQPVLPPEKLATFTDEQLFHYVNARKTAEEFAAKNPVGAGWTLPMWEKVMANWTKYRTHVILGGNRCVRGDTLIYDPVLDVARRIDSIRAAHHVLAWDGHKLVVAHAEEPFTKLAGPMLAVRLSSGEEFVGALEHRVLLSDGSWRQLSALRVGYALCQPHSTLGSDPLVHGEGAPRLFETPSGSQADYRVESRLCDELLRETADFFRDASPSPAGAPTHISGVASNPRLLAQLAFDLQQHRLGALGRIFSHIPILRSLYHLSTLDALRQRAARFVDIESGVSCTPCKSASVSRVGQGCAEAPRLSTAEFCRPQSTGGFHQRGTQSRHGVAYVTALSPAGTEVKWDMTVPAYGNYYAGGAIHHNSSKSVLASRLCVWALGNVPEAEIRAYHVNKLRSEQDQQRMIWEALPQGIKNLPMKKGQHHNIQFTQRLGFTGSECILPPLPDWRRGGSILFGNYSQYSNDEQVTEGFKAHVLWLDEECPVKMFETLGYRLVDYHGRMILTFTTLDGWTPLVQTILGRTRTLESRYAPLAGRKLPVIQESLSRPGTCIYYFWTEDNPFIDVAAFKKEMVGRPMSEILARAYGIPTKAATAAFPTFDREVHVVKHDDIPFIKDKRYPVTRYMALDPAGRKNWFMIWVGVDAAGTWWVYREWPDYDKWALPGATAEGKPGPAQQGGDKGIAEYAELIRQLEDGEPIFERIIDPRSGAAVKQGQEGATTIITDMDKEDITFIPAPGLDIRDGLALIRGLLHWNKEKPRDSLNAPKLYISDRCENVIDCMADYTAKGGDTEASKEVPDLLRYLATSNISHYTKGDMDPETGDE